MENRNIQFQQKYLHKTSIVIEDGENRSQEFFQPNYTYYKNNNRWVNIKKEFEMF